MTQQEDVVIIGGGRAGLALSYYLTQQRRTHVVLEQGRVAETWRSQRWDSFTLVTPNWMTQLPGFPSQGDDPDAFLPRDDVVAFLERYARSFQAPLRCGVNVNSVGTHVRLWIARGEIERAAHWAEKVQNEKRHSAPLARELEDIAVVRVVLAQHKTAEALMRLVPLLETATKQERWGSVIELLLLQMLAYLGRQEEQAALTALTQAVHLADPEGYMRSFLDQGVPMAALLSKLRDQQRKQGPTPYLDSLLEAFKSEGTRSRQPQPQMLPDPLSKREQEVLHLLVRGASNQDIAEELVVTLDTVKRHVSNILSKLGVSNRTQAVSRARELGLLTPERQHPFDGHTPPG